MSTNLLNNPSVAAFIGALCAFLLVVINDWRRDRRKLKLILNEIKVTSEHSKNKVETLKKNRDALKNHNQIIVAPILKFSSSIIRQLSTEILDKFTLDQRQSIDAICYTMEAIDSLLDKAWNTAEQIRESKTIESNPLCDQLLIDYNDGVVNLNRLYEMCENYISKKYREIVSKQYARTEYEE